MIFITLSLLQRGLDPWRQIDAKVLRPYQLTSTFISTRLSWPRCAKPKALAGHSNMSAGRRLDSSNLYLNPADGPGRIGEPVPLRTIVFPHYDPDSPNEIVPAGRADAMHDLLSGAANLSRIGPKGFKAVAGLVEQADCFILRFNDLRAAVGLIRGSLRPLPETAT